MAKLEIAELRRFRKLIFAEKVYNPQLNQIKDQMERIRYGMKNKEGDARKGDQEKLDQLKVRKDRLERITEVK